MLVNEFDRHIAAIPEGESDVDVRWLRGVALVVQRTMRQKKEQSDLENVAPVFQRRFEVAHYLGKQSRRMKRLCRDPLYSAKIICRAITRWGT